MDQKCFHRASDLIDHAGLYSSLFLPTIPDMHSVHATHIFALLLTSVLINLRYKYNLHELPPPHFP